MGKVAYAESINKGVACNRFENKHHLTVIPLSVE